jgi:predicted amidohydrolase
LFNNAGKIVDKYDKIHLFDIDLPGGESYRESATVAPGGKACITKTPWGGVGLSVCYDLRFPHLYRKLAHSGADILTAPAAFTIPTGKAHWEVLLRARAIETGCFVLAPAQTGVHAGGRKTYGHSMIVGPWGDVLAGAGDEPGLIYADLNMNAVKEARESVPSLRHDREIV